MKNIKSKIFLTSILFYIISSSYGNASAVKKNNLHKTTNFGTVFIPDGNFEQKLFELGIDNFVGDHLVQRSAVENITSLNVSNSNISDLTGIEAFTNLQSLDCSANQIQYLQIHGLLNLATINCSYNLLTNLDLNSLPSIQQLDCSLNPLQSLDLTNIPSLIYLESSFCELTTINVTGLIHLTTLRCAVNQLQTLNISTLTALTNLHCQDNQLTNLQANNLVTLQEINCSNNNLIFLGVLNLTALTNLNCSNNQLVGINTNTLSGLQFFSCSNNLLNSLNVSNSHLLVSLTCSHNTITNLNMSGLTNMILLDCTFNNLTSLNLVSSTIIGLDCTNNPNLICITVSDIIEAINNQSWYKDATAGYSTDCGNGGSTSAVLTGSTTICQGETANISINITGGTAPYTIVYSDGSNEFTINQYNSNNAIPIQLYQDTSFTIVSVTDANSFTGTNNSGTAIITVLTAVFYYADADHDGYGNPVEQIMACNGIQPTGYADNNYDCDDNNYNINPARAEIMGNNIDDNCNGIIDENYTEIPDVNFEQALFDLGIDAINGDHKVLTSAINTITSLDVSGKAIYDLKGIEGFVSLTDLNCYANLLLDLDVTGLSNLTNLNCKLNGIDTLNLHGLNNLLYLDCSFNSLTSINLTGVSNVLSFECNNNFLSSLNVSEMINLITLNCNNNSITSLNLNNLHLLASVNCNHNSINNLNLNGSNNLQELDCSTNLLSYLDVSNITTLTKLNCKENQLTELLLDSNQNLEILKCYSNFITNLDVSSLPSISYMDCRSNQLQSLNVVGLLPQNADVLYCSDNPSLQCITVSNPDEAYSVDQLGLWVKDATAHYSLSCEQNTLLNATMSENNSICIGNTGQFSVNAIGGTPPYTIKYNDGATTTTVSNYISGTSITVTPNQTTTYTLISISDSNNLLTTGQLDSTTIEVVPNIIYYADADGDGFGNPSVYQFSCNGVPEGYVEGNHDCDDNNPNITIPTEYNIIACDQSFCNTATVEDLRIYPESNSYSTAWYSTPAGGESLSIDTILTTGTYYAEQTLEETTSVCSPTYPKDVAVHPDGSLIILDYYGIEKYNENSGWGFSNISSTVGQWFSFGTIYKSITIDDNNKILVSTENGLYRFNVDGSNFEHLTYNYVNSIAVQNNGKIIGDFNGKIYRYNSDGSLDGIVLDSGTPQISFSSVAVQPDGKILFLEQDNTDFYPIYTIKRMNTYGADIQPVFENSGSIYDMATQPNSKIIFTDYSNNSVKRINSDGTGIETIGPDNLYGEPRGLSCTSNDVIYYADFFNNDIKKITYTTPSRTPIQVTINDNEEHITTVVTCDSYTWNNNNQTYTSSGLYTGITTNCVTEKLNLTLDCNLSNTDNILDDAIIIYPNPTQNYINIKTLDAINLVEIYDANGRQLLIAKKIQKKFL